MTQQTINQGDLLAYLDGERRPHVTVALLREPVLRDELEALREADRFLYTMFGGILCPDSQDLVDVATEQATSEQALRVAAYLRNSAEGRSRIELLNEAAQEVEQGLIESEKEPVFLSGIRSLLPLFFARPLPKADVRAGGLLEIGKSSEKTFYVAQMEARVTLYVSPPVREVWLLEGYVTQNALPVDEVSVTLQQEERLVASTTTEEGFFTFESVEAGCYQIQVQFEQGILVIREIELDDE